MNLNFFSTVLVLVLANGNAESSKKNALVFDLIFVCLTYLLESVCRNFVEI